MNKNISQSSLYAGLTNELFNLLTDVGCATTCCSNLNALLKNQIIYRVFYVACSGRYNCDHGCCH